MAILSTETLDDIGEGVEIDTPLLGSGWVRKNGMATALAAAAAHGARGGQIQSAASPYRIEYEEAATTSLRVYSWYFRLDGMATGNAYIGSLMSAGSGADFRVNTDRTVTLRNGTSATGGGASANQLAVGTWYRVEWMASSDGQELRIYEGESVVPHIAIVGALTDTEKTGVAVGVTSSPNGISLSIDTLRVADDWAGPYGSPAVPLDVPANFQFNAHPGPDNVSIEASWGSVVGAGSYELVVERREGDIWIPLNIFRVTGTTRTLTTSDGLTAGTTYRGQVRALPSGW